MSLDLRQLPALIPTLPPPLEGETKDPFSFLSIPLFEGPQCSLSHSFHGFFL